MTIFTKRPQQAALMLSQPSHIKCDFACQWLGNADMYMFAESD